MSTVQPLTIEYVRQCLRYEDGKLFWLTRPESHFMPGAAKSPFADIGIYKSKKALQKAIKELEAKGFTKRW